MDFKRIKTTLTRFWRSDNPKVSLFRDVTVALLVVLILLLTLWTYTGQWFSAPMVAIESGSMRHLNEPFGRLGTINAGDMVLLVKVNGRDDILTQASEQEKGAEGHQTYGNYGDVIVYRKHGSYEEDQIIHRAMCWVDYHEEYGTYTVDAYDIHNESSITITELGLRHYQPPNSGFITKGDNPITNNRCDQAGGICDDPIKVSWITGKARGELPWIGTINLLFNDIVSGRFWDHSRPTVYNVPTDCMICLVILIIGLVSIPISLDVYDYYREKQQKKRQPYP
jgi:signal peptidase